MTVGPRLASLMKSRPLFEVSGGAGQFDLPLELGTRIKVLADEV